MKEDEIAMKQKRLKAKEESNKKFDNLIKKSITGDKLESMKSQDLLRAQMQLAYKRGIWKLSSASRNASSPTKWRGGDDCHCHYGHHSSNFHAEADRSSLGCCLEYLR
ncbi:unnamed protein product [Ascophyllum nodosum]